MRILHVITKSEAGGAQTHVCAIARYLRDMGHEVHITSYPGGWLHDQARKAGILFHANPALSNSLNPIRGLAASRHIAGLARDIRPDIIHCHGSSAGFWTRIALRNAIPTLFTAHGWGFTPGAPRVRRTALYIAEKLVSKFTASYICVSNFDKALAIRCGIASSEKFVVIHNGVELLQGKRSKPEGAAINVVFVGRLARPKEPELVVQAWSEMPADVREACTLRIVGGGPLLPEVQKSIAHTGGNIDLVGEVAREEVLRILGESHIFVLMSRYEGFPISVLEAMSMELAVISSDVGGVREAVSPECGILIRRGDVRGLRDALTQLCRDAGSVARMGGAARRRIEREFAVSSMCEKTVAVYEEILKRSGNEKSTARSAL